VPGAFLREMTPGAAYNGLFATAPYVFLDAK
jgi:hypothetical protein